MDGSIGLTERVARLASRGWGVVARSELLAAGVSPSQIESWKKRGYLRTRHRGVYSVGSDVLPPEGRLRAATLACGASAVISHQSAAALWGFAPEPELVHVTVASGMTVRRPGVILHRDRRLAAADLAVHRGIACTTVARTLCDITASDSFSTGLDLASRAIRKRLVTVDALHSGIERRRNRSGAPSLVKLARVLDSDLIAMRSWLERRFRRLCRRFEIPPYEANVRVAGFEVDCLWRDQKLVVELDGRAYHSDAGSFEGDRERDAAVKTTGHEVLRITYRMLEDTPERSMKQLRQLLRQRSIQLSGG